MKRTALKRSRKPQLKPETLTMARKWGEEARKRPCATCGFKQEHGKLGIVQGHHVIDKDFLKREGVDESRWYDLSNMLPLCSGPGTQGCHEAHEWSRRRVTRAVVFKHAPRAIVFAKQVNLIHRFDMEYPA